MDELLIMIYHQDKGNLQVILSKDKRTEGYAWGAGFYQWQMNIWDRITEIVLAIFHLTFS